MLGIERKKDKEQKNKYVLTNSSERPYTDKCRVIACGLTF